MLSQKSNIPDMFVACSVLNNDKSIEVNFLHPLNIFLKDSLLLVIILLKSIFLILLQFSNMLSKVITFKVLNFPKKSVSRELQFLNIAFTDMAFWKSNPSKFTLTKFRQSSNIDSAVFILFLLCCFIFIDSNFKSDLKILSPLMNKFLQEKKQLLAFSLSLKVITEKSKSPDLSYQK